MVTHESGKFYVGRHSTSRANDKYMGSGKWVRSIKDRSQLTRQIIEYFDTVEQLFEAEENLIAKYIDTDGCMNFNRSSVGFSVGNWNPNKSPERRKIASERMSGDKNPAKRLEVRKKMSESQKGI